MMKTSHAESQQLKTKYYNYTEPRTEQHLRTSDNFGRHSRS